MSVVRESELIRAGCLSQCVLVGALLLIPVQACRLALLVLRFHRFLSPSRARPLGVREQVCTH